MALTAPVLAGETATPKQHSLIHRPDAPTLPIVPRPESAVMPSRPVAATAPAVAPPASQTLHHKLTKKPASAAVSGPLASEPSPTSGTSSRLSSAGNIPTTTPQTGSESPSKSTPAPVGDRTIVPIATRPISMSSLSNIAAPPASRNTAAAAPLTAAAQSGLPIASLAPSMSRLVQMSPGLAGLLQPSAPVVTPSSTLQPRPLYPPPEASPSPGLPTVKTTWPGTRSILEPRREITLLRDRPR